MFLNDGCPLPPIEVHWTDHHAPEAMKWFDMLESRLGMYEHPQSTWSNGAETVDLDSIDFFP